MKTTTLILTLAVCFALMGAAIVSAIFGMDFASRLAQNPIIIGCWVALCLLIVVGFVLWKRMLTNPGLFAMHAGCVAVIAGAMWGSDIAHKYREEKTGTPVPATSFTPLYNTKLAGFWTAKRFPTVGSDEFYKLYIENPKYRPPASVAKMPGMPANHPHFAPTSNEPEFIEKAELQFSLRCDKLWKTYYMPADPWRVYVATPDYKLVQGEKPSLNQQFNLIQATGKNHTRKLPGDLKVDIMESWSDEQFQKPTLLVMTAGRKTVPVEAVAGKIVEIKDAGVRFKILKVFRNIVGNIIDESKPESLDNIKFHEGAPEGFNPAVLIEHLPGSEIANLAERYKKENPGKPVQKLRELINNYAFCRTSYRTLLPNRAAAVLLAQENPFRVGEFDPPVMKIKFSRGEKSLTCLAVVSENYAKGNPEKFEFVSSNLANPNVISLEQLFAEKGKTPEQVRAAYKAASAPGFVLTRARLAVKGYFADVSVVQNEKIVERKTISVNDPLHFGGFYFYLQSMSTELDENRDVHHYAFLKVRSDAGIYWVYSGFALICAGLIIQLWIVPLFRKFKKQENPATVAGENLEHKLHDEHTHPGGAK